MADEKNGMVREFKGGDWRGWIEERGEVWKDSSEVVVPVVSGGGTNWFEIVML